MPSDFSPSANNLSVRESFHDLSTSNSSRPNSHTVHVHRDD